MRLVDLGTHLSIILNVDQPDILWAKAIYEIDATQAGGWMFIGDWLNLRLSENIKAPCPIICCTVGRDESKIYHLFILQKDGLLEDVMNAKGQGWSTFLLPPILEFYKDAGETKIELLKISGEPLKNARWLQELLPPGKSTLEDATAFALKFTKDMWTKKRFENNDNVQSKNTHP